MLGRYTWRRYILAAYNTRSKITLVHNWNRWDKLKKSGGGRIAKWRQQKKRNREEEERCWGYPECGMKTPRPAEEKLDREEDEKNEAYAGALQAKKIYADVAENQDLTMWGVKDARG